MAYSDQCSDLINTCDQALRAQDNEIVGLRDALKQSREQTDRAIDKRAQEAPILGTVEAIVLGVAAGAILGLAVRR